MECINKMIFDNGLKYERFSAGITSASEDDYYFAYDLAPHLEVRQKYAKFSLEVWNEAG